MFADDTNIFIEAKTKQEAYTKANGILKDISLYMKCNKLHINAQKSVFMNFSGTKTEADRDANLENSNLPGLMIDDLEIEEVTETKFLGVIIDDQLSWEPHITALRRKLNHASATLYRIRDSLPKCLHKDLYHTLFESHLV